MTPEEIRRQDNLTRIQLNGAIQALRKEAALMLQAAAHYVSPETLERKGDAPEEAITGWIKRGREFVDDALSLMDEADKRLTQLKELSPQVGQDLAGLRIPGSELLGDERPVDHKIRPRRQMPSAQISEDVTRA